jgi:hypothetical protein
MKRTLRIYFWCHEFVFTYSKIPKNSKIPRSFKEWKKKHEEAMGKGHLPAKVLNEDWAWN